MPRRPRLELAGCPMHLTHRGNNRCAVFLDDEDFNHYRQTLADVFSKHEIQLHGYVLMHNHVHLLLTQPDKGVLSNAMRMVGTRYVPYFNQRHGRCGALWEGRFKTCLVDSEAYLLNVLRYIELNPVRAMLCEAALSYRWSSVHFHLNGIEDRLLSPHECYLRLGENEASRRSTYRDFINQGICDADVAAIRWHMQQERALGSPRFQALVEKTLIRPAACRPCGRPIVNSNVNDLRPH